MIYSVRHDRKKKNHIYKRVLSTLVQVNIEIKY